MEKLYYNILLRYRLGPELDVFTNAYSGLHNILY